MAYSLKLLTTHAQCDVVLTYAQTRLGLLHPHPQPDHRADHRAAPADDAAAELMTLDAYLTALPPMIATLPPGQERERQANDLRLKTARRDTLLARQSQQGPEALVEAELDATLVAVQLPLVQALLTQVTAHRATLAA